MKWDAVGFSGIRSDRWVRKGTSRVREAKHFMSRVLQLVRIMRTSGNFRCPQVSSGMCSSYFYAFRVLRQVRPIVLDALASFHEPVTKLHPLIRPPSTAPGVCLP